MIEKFTKEELATILKELRDSGLKVTENNKGYLVTQEAVDVLGCDPFITDDVRKGIYLIADFFTNNYERKGQKGIKRSRKDVPEEIESEYRRIIKGILEVVKPHYGMLGFCRKK